LNHRRLSGVVKALFRCILGPYGEYSVSNAPQMASTTLQNPSAVNALYTLLATKAAWQYC
jgi:hypothetical protein